LPIFGNAVAIKSTAWICFELNPPSMTIMAGVLL
jgi:hypothetical protein